MTSQQIFNSDHEAKKFVNDMLVFLKSYLESDIGMDKIEVVDCCKNYRKILLNNRTSVVYVKGEMKVMIAISFESELIHHIFKVFTSDIDVEASEIEDYIDETACDIINITVGRVLESVAGVDRLYHFSPPIVIEAGKSIASPMGTTMFGGSLKTEHGQLRVFCIFSNGTSDGF